MIYSPTSTDKDIYKDMRVAIVTPCGGYSNAFHFTKSLVNMVAYSMRNGLDVDTFGGTQRMVIHWARNELCRKVMELDPKPTHILWLDDDHTFNPDLLCYLARHGDKDVVSALYYGRSKPLPVAYVKDKSPDKYKHYPLIWPPVGLCEVDAVGFGACLMRYDVLERVPEPWFKFIDCGEDIYFCVHAKENGVKVWLDASYQLGHIGDPHIIGHADYKQYVSDHEEEFGPKIKVGLGS